MVGRTVVEEVEVEVEVEVVFELSAGAGVLDSLDDVSVTETSVGFWTEDADSSVVVTLETALLFEAAGLDVILTCSSELFDE